MTSQKPLNLKSPYLRFQVSDVRAENCSRLLLWLFFAYGIQIPWDPPGSGTSWPRVFGLLNILFWKVAGKIPEKFPDSAPPQCAFSDSRKSGCRRSYLGSVLLQRWPGRGFSGFSRFIPRPFNSRTREKHDVVGLAETHTLIYHTTLFVTKNHTLRFFPTFFERGASRERLARLAAGGELG